jgi:hypothetical protein
MFKVRMACESKIYLSLIWFFFFFSKYFKHFHDRIISLRGGRSLAYETSLTPPHFLLLEVPVPSQKIELSYIFVLGVSILLYYTIFPLYFRTVQTVWYFFFFISLSHQVNMDQSELERKYQLTVIMYECSSLTVLRVFKYEP